MAKTSFHTIVANCVYFVLNLDFSFSFKTPKSSIVHCRTSSFPRGTGFRVLHMPLIQGQPLTSSESELITRFAREAGLRVKIFRSLVFLPKLPHGLADGFGEWLFPVESNLTGDSCAALGCTNTVSIRRRFKTAMGEVGDLT